MNSPLCATDDPYDAKCLTLNIITLLSIQRKSKEWQTPTGSGNQRFTLTASITVPLLSSPRDPHKIQLMKWGLIPYRTKNLQDAMTIRTQTLMARSEEMFEKYSYAELVKAGKRCLIPATGYFEHRWLDGKGKTKIPYHIFLKSNPIFSIGGLYSKWTDPETGNAYFTYTVCTTAANELAAMIHNTGKRMPVILATKEAEQAWLNPNLSQEEVLKLCLPIESNLMEAYTVSRVITSKDPNVPEAIEPFSYAELQTKDLFS